MDLTFIRNFILECQLMNRSPSVKGMQGALKIIEQLGYIQIDTISVIERAHHHVIWSRAKHYNSDDLAALEAGRHVFEYWAHAAAYLPMSAYRYQLPRKAKIAEGKGFWWGKEPKLMQYVLDRITAEGPLMSKDFENRQRPKVSTIDFGQNPVRRALFQLFMEGKLMVAERKGFHKSYDLPERLLPNWVDTSMPTEEEALMYEIRTKLKAHGILTYSELKYLRKLDRLQLQRILAKLVDTGELMTISLSAVPGQVYYADKSSIEAFEQKRKVKRIWILSPFDNLIIQRNRANQLFGLDYKLECYVPKAKRKKGYFVLPVMYGDQFVAQLDLKADRKQQRLIVKQAHWEDNKVLNKHKEKIYQLLLKELHAFAEFNKCQQIDWETKLQ